MEKRRWAGGLLSLVLLTGCAGGGASLLPTGGAVDLREAEEELDLQLGLLRGEITDAEYSAALELYLKIKPIRDERLARGEWERSDYERRLLRRLSRLYDDYTIEYLGGDELGFGYRNPPMETLAVYTIGGGALTPEWESSPPGAWTEAELFGLWEEMRALLPEGAFDRFGRLTFFTDGPGETMAYVLPLDREGTLWEIALDPADAGDREYFVETVLHEYCHYLTLNHEQVTYTREQTVDTYNESGMVSRKGSYLDDFYQEFWTGYLDDCLSCEDTYNFFLRHYDDFIDPYASTDPSEDICESFAFFVLRPRNPWGEDEVWSRKLNFFYDYPELVSLRESVRENLGLGRTDFFESYYGGEAA